MEQNAMPFPEAFLKRWLINSNAQENEQWSQEDIEKQVEAEFGTFKKSLQWSLVRGKLLKLLDVKIEQQDIKAKMEAQIMGYFQGQQFGGGADFIKSMVDRMMGDEEQVNKVAEEVLTEKMFEGLGERVNLNLKATSKEEFDALMEKIRAENNPQPEVEVQMEDEEDTEAAEGTEETEATTEE